MTTKYLVTNYIAGQHNPHGNAMWSLARKPGCLWETVISGPRLLWAQLSIRAVLCQTSLAYPNMRATATTAEESGGDGSCCVTRGQCPLASQSQQFSWMCREACLWECIGLPLSPHVHMCVLACVAPSPSEGTLSPTGPPLPFLWCRMFGMMTRSIEAMCCHNVTSLNKVFRAVFTEPEHEQQNPPITVSFCVVVKVSNVSNFLW